jgi:hypothetical protein
LLDGQWAVGEPRGQGLTLQVLHDQEVDAVLMANVVEHADVRMIQGGNGPGLALETRAELLMANRIAGLVNLAHAAPAHRLEDPVRPEFRPRFQAHTRSLQSPATACPARTPM